MYLIDRGKLLMQMMHKFHYELPDGCNNSLYGDVMKVIEDAPLIEAEPVRYGYWENANGRPKTYIRKCSVCGKEAYFCGRWCSYKFCPNCGAKMRLEE